MGMAEEEEYMNRRRHHRQHSILIGLVLLLLLLLSYNIYTSVLEIHDHHHHQEIQEKNMTGDDDEYVRIRTIDMAFKAFAADRLNWYSNWTGDDNKYVRIRPKFGPIDLAFGAAATNALPPIFQFRSDPNALRRRRRRRDMPKPSNLLLNINHGVELLFSDQLWWPSIIIIIVFTLLYFLFLFANTIFILKPKCWSAVNPRIQALLGTKTDNLNKLPLGPKRQAGEERFSIELDENNQVWYEVLSFSKPAHFLSFIGYPYVQLRQKYFAHQSANAVVKHVTQQQQPKV